MQPAEVTRLVLAHLPEMDSERVSLSEAAGRVLASPVLRTSPDPPFTRSRVDGYALALADVENGGDPRAVAVAGTTAAGEEPPAAVAPGTAWRVMAGAALGRGVGAVVPFEETPEGEKGYPGGWVHLPAWPRRGENVILAGVKGKPGDLIFSEGTLLGPLEVARLAGAGVDAVPVFHRPRVAIRSSGSELTEPGLALAPGKVYASNPHLLSCLVTAWGGEARSGAAVPDRLPAVVAALSEAACGSEVVILTGGVGQGDRDLTRAALAELGWPLILDDPAFLTGRSCAVARATGGPLVFLLPGGPGSCLAAFTFLVAPALARLSGRRWGTIPALLDGELTHKGAPLPVVLRLEEGRLWAKPRPHRSGVPDGEDHTDGFLPPQAAVAEAHGLVLVWPVQPAFPLTGWIGRK